MEELVGPAAGAGEECVCEDEEGEEVDRDACRSQSWWCSVFLRFCVGVPIWWSQMSVHSEAMSPSSWTFFAWTFRLLGAFGSFCACMSAVCVFPSAPLPLCVVAMVAALQYAPMWGARV